MCARHVKRAIEEFNIKLPKKLEEKDEKKALPQYNCQVHVIKWRFFSPQLLLLEYISLGYPK